MSENYLEDSELAPHISIVSQYIKDFSFENPEAPKSLMKFEKTPQVELALDLKITRLPEEENTFEVTLQVEAEAKADGMKLFLVELVYAGIFTLINIPEDQVEPALAIHCPAMLFPFARRIIADVTQDSGFQPLRIDPIDFGRLYQQKLMEGEASEQLQ